MKSRNTATSSAADRANSPSSNRIRKHSGPMSFDRPREFPGCLDFPLLEKPHAEIPLWGNIRRIKGALRFAPPRVESRSIQPDSEGPRFLSRSIAIRSREIVHGDDPASDRVAAVHGPSDGENFAGSSRKKRRSHFPAVITSENSASYGALIKSKREPSSGRYIGGPLVNLDSLVQFRSLIPKFR